MTGALCVRMFQRNPALLEDEDDLKQFSLSITYYILGKKFHI